MSKFLRRRVVILGRSVPLTAILLAVTVIAAGAWAAAFLLMPYTIGGTATSAGAPITLTINNPSCELVGTSTGTIASCGKVGNGFALSVTGISSNLADGNPTIVRVRQDARNTGAANVCLVSPPVSSDPAVNFNGSTFTSPLVAGAPSYSENHIYVHFDGIEPGETLSGVTGEARWENCP